MKLPKSLENAFFFYPGALGLWIGYDLLRFIREPGTAAFGRLIFSSYLVSPLLWRLARLVFEGKEEGAFRVGKKERAANLWLLYYQLQVFYTHFAFFERALRLFPGFYSAWLRLWGSKIGKKVNWTAECQIVDRGHLEVGDRAFFGNRCYVSAHALKKLKTSYLLFVKKVKVGADTMISYASHVGPGVQLGSRVHVAAGAELYPNTRVPDGETYAHQ